MVIKLHVWGDYACFTRPEMKVERVSYDVITPSAARGILEAIHWKPAIRWIVTRLHVLRPIRFDTLRQNEVGSKISRRGTPRGPCGRGRPRACSATPAPTARSAPPPPCATSPTSSRPASR